MSTGFKKLHKVSADNIVDNTEQPIKTRQSMQTGQLMKQAFSKQIKWNVNWIVKSYTKSV